MDVQDRSLRVDVLTITAPAPKEGASLDGAAVLPPENSFAASLQKAQPKPGSVPPATMPAEVMPPSAVIETPAQPNAGLVIPTDDAALAALTESLVGTLKSVPIEAPIAAPVPKEETTGTEESSEIDQAAQWFAAAMSTVVAPLPTPPSTPVVDPTSTPRGLAQAISSAPARPMLTGPVAQPTAESTAKMPAGLQAALAMEPVADSVPVITPPTLPATISAPTVVPGAPAVPTGSVPTAVTNSAPREQAPPVASVQPQVTVVPNVKPVSGNAESATGDDAQHESTEEKSTPDQPRDAVAQSDLAPMIAASTPITQDSFTPKSKQEIHGLAAVASSTGEAKPAVPRSEMPASGNPEQTDDDSSSLDGAEMPVMSDLQRGSRLMSNSAAVETVPASPSAILEQLQPALHRAAESNQQLSIVLRPPELGAVRIDISQHAGRMTARLETETATTHQLLRDSLPQLQDVLAPLGVSADQIQINRLEISPTTSWDGNGRADLSSDPGTSGSGQEQSPQPTPEPLWNEEPDRTESSSTSVQSRTAINLRI